MKLSKVRIVGVTMLLFSSMAMSVFAYEYVTSQQIPTGIVIKTPTAQIGIYWDYHGTQPVTVIDFGEQPQPNADIELYKALYIRNDGDVPLVVYWNSTLSHVTGEITESWFPNGTTMGLGYNVPWHYAIDLPAYVTTGNYNWTLTVWGEY